MNTVFKSKMLNIVAAAMATALSMQASAQDYVGSWGQLSVQGTKIVNEHGQQVQLQGMSLFWSQWSAQWWNYETVKWLKDDWCINVIRAAMGVDSNDGGYIVNRGEEQRVRDIIDAAVDLGIYVIIDWHSHHAHHTTGDAEDFFRRMAKDYGHLPNVIYEVWNEPLAVNWSGTIKPHCEAVIGAIREHDPDGIVICGTEAWSQKVDDAAWDPITWTGNIAYTLHYYASTHGQWLRDKGNAAMAAGACVFVTEYGVTEASGNGHINEGEAYAWWDWMQNNGIGHCNWSVHNKDESSSALQPWVSAKSGWSSGDLKHSGNLVRGWLVDHCPQVADPTDCAGVPNGNAEWDPCGQCAGGNTGVTPCVREPYDWTPQSIPGRLEAEDFDWGGQGVTWNETNATNQGGAEHRQYEEVDVEEIGGGDHAVGYIEDGEWLEYTVNVTASGSYALTYSIASKGGNGQITMKVDGQNAGSVDAPDTGGWGDYQEVDASSDVDLSAGEHVIRLEFTGGFNLAHIDIEAVGILTDCAGVEGGSAYRDACDECVGGTTGKDPCVVKDPNQSPYGGTPHAIPGMVEAEQYDEGGDGIAYSDDDADNQGGEFRNDGVDIEQVSGNNYNVGWIEAGEWLEYTVDVEQTGNYTVTFNLASDGGGGLFHLESDGQDVTGAVSADNTGGWQSFEEVQVTGVSLTKGQHVFRFAVDAGGFNVDNMDFDLSVGLWETKITGDEFVLYPNPASTQIFFGSRYASSQADVEILNQMGQVVLQAPNTAVHTSIDISGLAPGVYVVNINNQKSRLMVR